jgi:hypothetical protein
MHIQLVLMETSLTYPDSNRKSCSFCEPNQFYPADIDLGFEIPVDPTNCWHRAEMNQMTRCMHSLQKIDKKQQTELYPNLF